MINSKQFIRFLKRLPNHDVDIMLEAKSKDKALLRLRKILLARRSAQRSYIII